MTETSELPSQSTVIMNSEILKSLPLNPRISNTSSNSVTSRNIKEEISYMFQNKEKENIPRDNFLNKSVSKFKYNGDQWSPLNLKGKKKYDRDFLLQLQDHPSSMIKPKNLPELFIIKDKPHGIQSKQCERFMPVNPRERTPRPHHLARDNCNRQGKNDDIVYEPKKLHESVNAWKPSRKNSHSSDGNVETQELYKKVRSILNKLTLEKIDTLIDQVKKFNIDSEEKLTGVINLVFEKALDEPKFSVPYAKMCKSLELIKVPLESGQGQVNFRKILLSNCQKEFERTQSDELKHSQVLKKIEISNSEKKKELQIEMEVKHRKMRKRQLGNIRFIGELFKLNMLTEPIMHDCIKKLLSQGDEDSLECLCGLLKTVGKLLSKPCIVKKKKKGSKKADTLDGYFSQIRTIVDKRKTSTRIRFLLQDVIDLKKNDWVPRMVENNPKTIEEIHKEAEQEAREAQQVLENFSYSQRMTDDRKKTLGHNVKMYNNKWIPASKSNKVNSHMFDPSKLKLRKLDEVENIRLGPGGRGPQCWGKGSNVGRNGPAAFDTKKTVPVGRGPQSWGKGNSGGRNNPAVSDMKITLTNRYSTLVDFMPSFIKESGSQRSASSHASTSNASVDERKLLEKDNKMQCKIKENDNAEALCLKGPELPEEIIEKKTKLIVDEFLNNNGDFQEATKCIIELTSVNTISVFIYYAVNQVLERSNQARFLLGQLLYTLVKTELLSYEQYKKGLSGILENVDDYALDIPLIWEYMGELIEPMIGENKLPFSFLKDVLEPCMPSENAGKLVSAVVRCADKRKGLPLNW